MATITVEPLNDIPPGATATISFGSFPAGPRDQRGYLAKRAPFEGVVFDSYTPVRLIGQADGMEGPIPADSARTFDSLDPQGFVRVTNPSSSTTVAKENIQIILFGDGEDVADADRQASRVNELQFSGAAVISDIVPGVTTRGHGE